MKKNHLNLALIILFCLGCRSISAQETSEANDYYLVWQDLFDEDILTANWNIEVNDHGGGNQELQYYRAENVSVGAEPASGKSCLILTARKESFGGKQVTSGRIHTQDKMSFQHGKLEASIRFPHTANGLWPAFWMLGNDISTVGWPKCSEIDICEMGNHTGINAGTQDRYFNGACHWGESIDENHPSYAVHTTNAYSLQDDFHLFTLIWDNNYIKMYLDLDKNPDANPYYEMDIRSATDQEADHPANYFHKPSFVLFNLAVGGNFPQIWDINQITALSAANNYEAKMYVDFIKLYQKGLSEENEKYRGPSPTRPHPVQTEKTQYNIAPDPSHTRIQISGPYVPSHITIFNNTGQEISVFENTNVCDISDLPDGNYLIKVENDKRLSESFRFVKKE
ncbi:MAG: family 16 glycosylhydrolase [Candidatus Azobacteroides sp.]|nr:family 16 glycosylhydrolase [Candidatus Azobacteroides sp.]